MSGRGDSLSEGLIGFFSYIVVEFRACISGVDSYVRNVDAAGSNPAKSTGFFVFFSLMLNLLEKEHANFRESEINS